MADTHAADHHHDHDAHSDAHMIKIYFILLALLVASLIGPEIAKTFEGSTRTIIVLVTAFGIAFVKAWLVIKNFMHLTVEKPIVRYMLITCLVFMILFFAGTSPDVLKHDGRNWSNIAAKAAIERAEREFAASAVGEHGGVEQPDEDGEGNDPARGIEGGREIVRAPGKPGLPTYGELQDDEAKLAYLMRKGELVYNEGVHKAPGSACVMCHRQDGAGYSGLASTLVGAADDIGTCEQTFTAILKGAAGPAPTEDGVAQAVMPGYPNLDDDQVAAVATYIRNSWGNSYGLCEPAAVAVVR